MAAFNLLAEPSTYGLGRALAGVVFGTGLMMVVLAGGELFTGNTLILAAVLEKKVAVSTMLRNWVIVYAGNLVGSVLIAYMMANSGLLTSGGSMLGAVTLKIAVYKVNLSFLQAFYLGIMCNWLVCLAVWISFGADTMAGKIFSIFFPIWLFITSGFEHSVANMYYIPAGILIKADETFAQLCGLSPEALDSLTWGSFAINNLVPVTLGNIIGGGIFVGMAYWYTYKKAVKRRRQRRAS
jgi:formate/nitrite transporter